MTAGLRIVAAGGVELSAGAQPTPLAPLYAALGSKPPRRSSRFAQLALLGAQRATGTLCATPDPGCALYLATGEGNVADTASMLEGLYRHGEPPMPFAFINVSSNVAGFQVAAALGLHGPNLTVSRRGSAFAATLELALADARSGRLQQALIGAVDECCWPLAHHRERLRLDAAGTPLGEGSHWFVVDNAAAEPLGIIETVARFDDLASLLAWLRTLPSPPAIVPDAGAAPHAAELRAAGFAIDTPESPGGGYYSCADAGLLHAALTGHRQPFALLERDGPGWLAIHVAR